MPRILRIVLLWSLLTLLAVNAYSQTDETVTLNLLWFEDDDRQGVVLQSLLDSFEETYPNIRVQLDPQAPQDVNARLEAVLRDGTDAPDIARTNSPSRFSEYLLDLRPYVADPDRWEQSFSAGFLASLRKSTDDNGIYGYPTDLTISAPFINRSLWEAAGVPVPPYETRPVSWDEWVTGALQVQAALSTESNQVYAVAFDRSGHRFWGPSLSMCASYVDIDDPLAPVQIDTPGFRAMLSMFQSWDSNGLQPIEIWNDSANATVPADRFFIDSQVAFYFSGNWQLGNFRNNIGERFNWEPVPNPTGDCAPSGMIGGSVMVAFNTTEHPEEVGLLMDYLTAYDNLERFYRENLLLPGNIEMNQVGLNYEDLQDELKLFQQEIERANPEAFALQYRPDSARIHNAIRLGVVDMISQDLTIDQAVACVQHYYDAAQQSVPCTPN